MCVFFCTTFSVTAHLAFSYFSRRLLAGLNSLKSVYSGMIGQNDTQPRMTYETEPSHINAGTSNVSPAI